jgi:uncharacterized membrane protein YadS
MIVVIPLLGFRYGRKNARKGPEAGIKIMRYIPLFVIGYIVMGIVRTLGDHFLGADSAAWAGAWQAVKMAATYTIAVSITCVGLSTDIRKLSKLGYRPFMCGLSAALSVGAVSWLIVTRLGRFLSL